MAAGLDGRYFAASDAGAVRELSADFSQVQRDLWDDGRGDVFVVVDLYIRAGDFVWGVLVLREGKGQEAPAGARGRFFHLGGKGAGGERGSLGENGAEGKGAENAEFVSAGEAVAGGGGAGDAAEEAGELTRRAEGGQASVLEVVDGAKIFDGDFGGRRSGEFDGGGGRMRAVAAVTAGLSRGFSEMTEQKIGRARRLGEEVEDLGESFEFAFFALEEAGVELGGDGVRREGGFGCEMAKLVAGVRRDEFDVARFFQIAKGF